MRLYSALRATALAVGMVLPAVTHAQDERLSIHGSANIGYGKTDGLPVFGLTHDGRSDYRVIALLFGYQISDKNRVVTQLLHRKFGESPLNAETPDIEPIWAFFEHKFDNGFTVKAGRNPLPRGIFNEIRFIGTLLPFYRVGSAVYGETLEYVDGVTVRKPFALGGKWSLDATVFAGGYDLKKQLPTSTGAEVVNVRNENSVGAQLWLNLPIDGVRVGVFADNYQATPAASLPEAQRPNRTTTMLYSAEVVRAKTFVRGELTTFTQLQEPGYVNFTSYYAHAGVNPTEKLTLAVEYGAGTNVVRFAGTPTPDLDLPFNKDLALGVTYKPSPQVAFKLEGHTVEGYQFDRPVPSVIQPSAPSLVARLAPASQAYYGIASIAFSF